MFKLRTRRLILSSVVLGAGLVAACSGTPGDPTDLYERMVGAYGGAEGLELITSYSGKGFMKRLPLIHVAESYPFDIYQDGSMLKTKLMRVEDGMLSGIRLVIGNEEESFQWSRATGKVSVPDWERELLKYRFPYVLEWIQSAEDDGEIIPAKGDSPLLTLRFREGNDIVTLGIEEKTWLLKEMNVRSEVDTTFLFKETYSDYRQFGDTWFPSRFSAYYGAMHYYEYFLVKIELGEEFPAGFFAILPEDTTGIHTPVETSAEEMPEG